MVITFRVGKYIDPSGFGLAVVDIPPLEPEKNVSLIDYSHVWEENVSSADASVLGSYVDIGGHLPITTVSDFLLTNIATASTKDRSIKAPLYYRHSLRFFHYSYGQNPGKQIYIVDQDENILPDLNHLVVSERVSENVYQIYVLTDFYNTKFTRYKIKYNRCYEDGSSIFPGWTETLNTERLFKFGTTVADQYQYNLSGPDLSGFYTPIVVPVPNISQLTNSIGISFENCPTLLSTNTHGNMSPYSEGIVVKYTLKATGPSTFTIKRDKDQYGVATSSIYLQSATATTWGVSPVNFTIGTTISSIYGMYVNVHGDHYLIPNDEAFFTAARSYFYLKPQAYRAVYLEKPQNVTQNDDWFMRVKNGRFRRRVDASGNAVPSGSPGSVLYEYSVPEYQYQMWDLVYGPPYKHTYGERAEILDKQNIQLKRTPFFIDPSSVLHNETSPGFPPSGFLNVKINDSQVRPEGILDWDIYAGTVKMAQFLNERDDVKVDYTYVEEFYEYTGFVASGWPGVSKPYPWVPLDVNPTPSHNYGMYASGITANIYLRPSTVIDDGPGGYGQSTVVANDTLYHTYTGYPSGVFDFLLGSVSIGPSCKISDIIVTDVRTRGGGLSKLGVENLEDVKSKQPEAEFFWDVGYFDGQAVPSNGVLVVRIPKTVLISNGGAFSEDEVRKKVLKHMALGEYPILEFV